MRNLLRLWPIVFFVYLLAACAAPRSLPSGPTAIPILIPATAPAINPGEDTKVAFTILSYPARPPSSAQGQQLYQTQCATCHGEDGKGVVPGARDFNDLDYMRGETPASFYAAVTEGRGEMPPFLNILSSDERWDVVFYMWRFSTNADTLALGKTIYDENCAACHGEDGVGQVLGAADFTDLRFVDDQAPRDFYLTLTQGKGSMPAFQGRLTQDERWAVIDYLRTFSYDPTLPGDTVVEPEAQPTAAEVPCSSSDFAQASPFGWDHEEAINAGKVLYNQSCAVCHGADGTGVLPSAPDLTTSEWQEELRSNSVKAFCITAEGQGSMPGWKETLTTEQMWEVLTYIGSFER
jgi:mono/diheme cytochrome c family protein